MEHVLNNFVLPTYRTFNDVAIPVGILQSNINNLDQWLSERFIGTHFRLNWNQIVFNNKPFYKWDCFKSKLVKLNIETNIQFVNSVKKHILQNFYLYLFANEKYIPYSSSYQKRNFIHDLCVYGFDDEKQVFLASAYNVDQHYAYEEISYQELYLAVKNFYIPIRQIEKIKWKRQALIFKISDSYNFNNSNPEKLKKVIYQYCTSYKYASGIRIYDFILYKINRALKMKKGIDLHYFRILQEHINAINKLNHPDIKYSEIYLLSENISIKALKYTLKNNDDLLLMMKKELSELRKKELCSLKTYAQKYFTKLQYNKFLRVYKKYNF